MDEKEITVGRRFSKRTIKASELSRLKSGLPKKITLQDLHLMSSEFSLEQDLKRWKTEFTKNLREKGLPAEPYYYPVEKKMGKWQPSPPEDFTPLDVYEKRISLSELLIIFGHDFDSIEYLEAQAVSQIYSIEKAMELNMHKEALEFAFGLGHTIALLITYGHMTVDSMKGGLSKKNPWRSYGKKLVEQHPKKTQLYRWKKIPKGVPADRPEDAEPDNSDSCGNCLFYRFTNTIDDKEVLVAKDDNTGTTTEITFDSFRTKYLSKKSRKKL